MKLLNLLSMLFWLFLVSLVKGYAERLELTQFKDGKVLAHLEFQQSCTSITHYQRFPKAIGEIVDAFELRELHLSFTQGRWDDESWGWRQSAPAGVQLNAWLGRYLFWLIWAVKESIGMI